MEQVKLSVQPLNFHIAKLSFCLFPFFLLQNQKYVDLKADLIRTERHLLKEMAFICHVEHPHKFISNYLATLKTPLELRQDAWNLANDRYASNLSKQVSKLIMHLPICIWCST